MDALTSSSKVGPVPCLPLKFQSARSAVPSQHSKPLKPELADPTQQKRSHVNRAADFQKGKLRYTLPLISLLASGKSSSIYLLTQAYRAKGIVNRAGELPGLSEGML